MTRSKLTQACNVLRFAAVVGAMFSATGCAVSSGSDEGFSQSKANTNKATGAGGGGGDDDPTYVRGGAGGSAGTESYGGAAGSQAYGGSGGGCNDFEVCANGVDDDCDGEVDEGCVVSCEDTDGHNCNADKGYGDHCAAEENTNGCSPAKFWAWCNRRNPKYPEIWDSYLKAWVEMRCDDEVLLLDPNQDGYPTYTCVDGYGRSWECTTPLVLSFAPGQAVQFEPSAHSFSMQPGRAAQAVADWPSAVTPWLAMDRDGSGAIESGAELFGSSTPLASGRLARNGFEALAELDGNADGRIDAADAAWAQLLVWADRNADGVSQRSELVLASELGLTSLSVAYRTGNRCDERGNCERERAQFVWSDGCTSQGGEAIDIYLRTRN
jgi:hypothetical protein